MVTRFDLNDFEEVAIHSNLHRYKKKSDGSMYSVKSLIVDKDFKPETHGVITTIQSLQGMKQVPKLFGYATKTDQDYMEILVFIEFSEGTLDEIVRKSPLNAKELSKLLNFLIDTFLDIDRNAYMTPPSYITPYNILVYEGPSGKDFKVFGMMPHAETRPIDDHFLRFTAPEQFERHSFRKTHIQVDAERSLFYSIGVVFIFAALGEILVTEARQQFTKQEFPLQNPSREEDSVKHCIQSISQKHNDPSFAYILSKFLAYQPNDRPNFRTWTLTKKGGGQSGPNTVVNTGGYKQASKTAKQANKQNPPQQSMDVHGNFNYPGGSGPSGNKPNKQTCCCSIF